MVESQPSKLLVASSILVSRSNTFASCSQAAMPLLLIAIFAATLLGQPSPVPSQELVTIEKLTVQGTRFPARSIEILTGLRPGLEIDESAVRKAIADMLESGLVRSVDYNYESLQDPHRVTLELDIIDETPLLPASIEIPGVDPEAVWRYLESLDPLFTREMPRTQKALRFYIRAISDYLHNNRRRDSLVPIVTGDGSGHPTGIVFVAAQRRTSPQNDSRRN
jgi:hypothetical protein